MNLRYLVPANELISRRARCHSRVPEVAHRAVSSRSTGAVTSLKSTAQRSGYIKVNKRAKLSTAQCSEVANAEIAEVSGIYCRAKITFGADNRNCCHCCLKVGKRSDRRSRGFSRCLKTTLKAAIPHRKTTCKTESCTEKCGGRRFDMVINGYRKWAIHVRQKSL